MKEILKRFSALLCLVAMLSLVSIPAFGGENPWDSDGSSGDNVSSGTTPNGDGTGFIEPLYLGTVYIGTDGLLTFVSHSFNYFVTNFTFLGRMALENPNGETEASQQKNF